MTVTAIVSDKKIDRNDLFCFRRPIIVEGGKESNLFYKSDVRSTFASTLDGDIAHAGKMVMLRAIKLPKTSFTDLTELADLFKGQYIEGYDLRASDYPSEVIVVGGEVPNKHIAFSNDPSLALELHAFVTEHNSITAENVEIEEVASENDKNDVATPSFNIANCF